jgi:chromosome segregation ATPase
VESANPTNRPAGVALEDLAVRRGLLQRVVRLYEKQLADINELEAARSRKAQVERQAQSWTGFPEPRPYSILLADGLHEDIQSVTLRIGTAETALEVIKKSLEATKDTLAQTEEQIRRLNEQLEAAKSSGGAAGLTWNRDLKRLQWPVARPWTWSSK